MDIRHQFDLQTDLPVFVRATPPGMKYLKFGGRQYSAGDHLPWQELGISYDIVKMFMDRHYLYHSDEKTVETKVGDGLDMMTWEEMDALVDRLNEKVQKNTDSKTNYDKYKCKKSRIREKQMGLIRSWRRHYGKFEAM